MGLKKTNLVFNQNKIEKKDLDEQLDELAKRIFQTNGTIMFLDEFYRCRNSKLYREYEEYLECVFSRFHNDIIIEICNIFDDSEDSISINKLKNYICVYLQDDRKNDLKKYFKDNRTKEIQDIIDNIKNMRNKCGVAHGNMIDYNRTIALDDIYKVINYVKELFNNMSKYYNGTFVNFDQSFSHKSLTNLVNEYELYSKKST